MADFDSFNYDIEQKLPEWWKGFGALEPINIYTQEVIISILETLLNSTGVVQPLNCWLTIPEEYTWFHHYKDLDEKLIYYNHEDVISNPTSCLMGGNDDRVDVMLPNTKRKCHAKIRLKLKGYSESDNVNDNVIESLILINGKQTIEFKNISKTSLIEISTEDNQILIDGKENNNLIEGSFKKIEPSIKYEDYMIPYIDEDGQEQKKEITIDYENKETKISMICSDAVRFDLQIYLYKPTYVTEQNIRISTVSAFPIEWVRLYGYYCHPFNNKEGYQFLWEKQYSEESRTVYDKIAKQYDCERFYIQVKFYGIGIPLSKGFPQEEYASDPKFIPNEHLDKWGKIYGIPRRYYKTNITEDEQPFTFPKYYPYSIEQDYWYEERMINEYRFDDESTNSWFVKDTDLNNIARLECIYPFMNDIWVYTETIDPSIDITHESSSIHVSNIKEDENSQGISWEDITPLGLDTKKAIILKPYNNETIKTNQFPYQTKKLKISFDLTPLKKELPKDIEIQGLELKFKALTDVRSTYLKLSEDSHILLPYLNYHSSDNGTDNVILEPISISGENNFWIKEKNTYTIGGSNNLFGRSEIKREQLFANNNKLDFVISFINENDFLNASLALDNISFKVYYKIIPDDYSIQIDLDKTEYLLSQGDVHINFDVVIENNSNKRILNKEAFLVFSPELKLESDYNAFTFNLEIDEKGDNAIRVPFELVPQTFYDEIKTGYYDILVFCEDTVIKKEILIREG